MKMRVWLGRPTGTVAIGVAEIDILLGCVISTGSSVRSQAQGLCLFRVRIMGGCKVIPDRFLGHAVPLGPTHYSSNNKPVVLKPISQIFVAIRVKCALFFPERISSEWILLAGILSPSGTLLDGTCLARGQEKSNRVTTCGARYRSECSPSLLAD